MGSYGSLGSAAPYVQAGSEGAVGSIVGGSIDNIKDRKKKHLMKKMMTIMEEFIIIMEVKLIIDLIEQTENIINNIINYFFKIQTHFKCFYFIYF